MRRREAILLLARILSSCQPTHVTFFSLSNPNSKKDGDAVGYELHLKCDLTDKDFNTIKGMISTKKLGLKEYDGRLVIYSPNKATNSLSIIV